MFDNTVLMACSDDGDNVGAGSVPDAGRQILVTFVDEHLLDGRQLLGEVLQHGLHGGVVLQLFQLLGGDFLLAEDCLGQLSEQLHLVPERGFSPCSFQSDLDFPVTKREGNMLFLGDMAGGDDFFSGCGTCLVAHALLIAGKGHVGNHEEGLVGLEDFADILVLPVLWLGLALPSPGIKLKTDVVRLDLVDDAFDLVDALLGDMCRPDQGDCLSILEDQLLCMFAELV